MKEGEKKVSEDGEKRFGELNSRGKVGRRQNDFTKIVDLFSV